MPQIQLPVFPAASTTITSELAFEQRDGQVFYFNGHLPVFNHAVDDIASFRFFASRLIANGTASEGQTSRAFVVPLITVKRMCKKLREHGAAAFYRSPPSARPSMPVSMSAGPGRSRRPPSPPISGSANSILLARDPRSPAFFNIR